MDFIFLNSVGDKVFIKGNKKYFSFYNSDGKRWLIPEVNKKTALQLYQPSRRRGKILKTLFPYVGNWSLVQNLLGVGEATIDLAPSLKDLLSDCFKTADPEFSVFMGTPSVHQKMTMQIFSGKTILGYCKISDKEAVKERFREEEKMLNYLAGSGIAQAPECLNRSALTEDTDIFVQTTKKTLNAAYPDSWGDLHEQFLSTLHSNTVAEIRFRESDYSEQLQRLSGVLGEFPDHQRELISDGIRYVNDHYGDDKADFSLYHGDFTPWNMFEEEGELFVFDWEYAKKRYPPYMDYFHFHTQTGIFEHHLDHEEIYENYNRNKHIVSRRVDDPDLLYLQYLLEVIAQYKLREGMGGFSDSLKEDLVIWTGLLECLLHRNEA